jgi:hypothetical protein
MTTTIYSTEDNSYRYIQLSKLAIAQITSGKRVSKQGFTLEQLHNIQKFANRLPQNKGKDFVIAYN